MGEEAEAGPTPFACSAAPWQCWILFAECSADGAVESWQMGQDGQREQELAGWRRHLSGKSRVGTWSPHPPLQPQGGTGLLGNSQHGASHPHRQPPLAAWELQEVDIEQKRHWTGMCLQCTQVLGPGLSGSPEGPKTPRWPCNRYQPRPESKGRPVPRLRAWQQGDTPTLATTLRGLPTLEEVLGSNQTEWPGRGREYNGLSQYSMNLQNPRFQLCAFQKPKGNHESEELWEGRPCCHVLLVSVSVSLCVTQIDLFSMK